MPGLNNAWQQLPERPLSNFHYDTDENTAETRMYSVVNEVIQTCARNQD